MLVNEDPALGATRTPADCITAFMDHVRAEGRVGASTREAYALDLRALQRWARQGGHDISTLDPAALRRYFVERRGQGAHAATLARHRSSFRTFYSFLMSRGIVGENPATAVDSVHVSHVPRPVLTADEAAAVLRPQATEGRSTVPAFRAARDHALVCALYETRLDIAEVRALRWDQVADDWQNIVSRHGGSLHRIPPRLRAALRELRNCAMELSADTGLPPHCFPSSTGAPLTRQGFCQAVRRWGEQARIDTVLTPSLIRQTGQRASHGLPSAASRARGSGT